MSSLLLPYDTIIKAHEGDPIAIQAVLDRYAGYIRYFSKMNGYYNSDMEDYIRTKLIESLFKFRLDRRPGAGAGRAVLQGTFPRTPSPCMHPPGRA